VTWSIKLWASVGVTWIAFEDQAKVFCSLTQVFGIGWVFGSNRRGRSDG
jgi:hypothetical protein